MSKGIKGSWAVADALLEKIRAKIRHVENGHTLEQFLLTSR
jgi:hypothetical protein